MLELIKIYMSLIYYHSNYLDIFCKKARITPNNYFTEIFIQTINLSINIIINTYFSINIKAFFNELS